METPKYPPKIIKYKYSTNDLRFGVGMEQHIIACCQPWGEEPAR